MLKVNFFDRKVRAIFYKYATGITGAIAAIVLFWIFLLNIKILPE